MGRENPWVGEIGWVVVDSVTRNADHGSSGQVLAVDGDAAVKCDAWQM